MNIIAWKRSDIDHLTFLYSGVDSYWFEPSLERLLKDMKNYIRGEK
jgi:hypothetical protein